MDVMCLNRPRAEAVELEAVLLEQVSSPIHRTPR
jgi:hypothetical protein